MSFIATISTSISRWQTWPVRNWVIALMLVAFLLRVVGVWADWPFGFLHIDEGFHIMNTTKLVQDRVLAPENLIYPTGFPVALTIPVGISVIAGFAMGYFSSIDEVAGRFLVEPGFIYVGSRVWIAMLGALTVGLVYQIGTYAFRRRAGMLAAVLLTVSLLHVEVSHFALPEVQVGFLVTGSLLFCLKYARSARLRDFLIASALFGLAVSTKQSALPLALTLLAAWVMARSLLAHDRRWAQQAVYGVLIAVLVFIVTSPVYITQFSSAFAENIGSDGETGFSKLSTGKIGLFDGPDYFWTFQMWLAEDWGIVVLAIAGIVLAALVRTKSDILLGLFAVGFFGAAATLAVHQAHYIIPVLPVMFVFAGRLADRGLSRARAGGINSFRITAAVLIVVVIVTGARSVALDVGLTGTDTRMQAREWVLDNVDPGSTIAITNVVYGPPLHDPEDQRFQGDAALNNPTVSEFIEDYLGGRTTFSITEAIADEDRFIPPDRWASVGWDYYVVSSFTTDPYLLAEPPPVDSQWWPQYENGKTHFSGLPESPYIEEVSRFSPSLRHPGPSLFIYRVLNEPVDPA